MQRGADHFGRIDDAGFDQIFELELVPDLPYWPGIFSSVTSNHNKVDSEGQSVVDKRGARLYFFFKY